MFVFIEKTLLLEGIFVGGREGVVVESGIQV